MIILKNVFQDTNLNCFAFSYILGVLCLNSIIIINRYCIMDFFIKNKTVCLIGKRNSGKSNLLKYLVSLSHDNFRTIFLISPTEQINNFYKGLINPNNIYSEYDEDWVQSLIEKMTKENTDKTDDDASHILLILDDCIASVNFNKSKTFKTLFVRGRHLKISIIITSQYINALPPIIRSNCDWIAVSQVNSQGLDLLMNEYRFGNIDKPSFRKMYLKNTSQFGFLLVNCSCCEDNNNLDQIYGCLKVPTEFVK
jgi:hypothetical protein